MDIHVPGIIPILRIFDMAKADEFYLGFLGFAVDWDHRFDRTCRSIARSPGQIRACI